MKSSLKKILVTAVVAGLALPAAVQATNGYFLIGYGSKARGMGGVGVAYPQDGLAAAYNPAGMAEIGTRFDIGGDLFMPERAVSHNSAFMPADVKSKGDFFPIPAMGGVWKYNDEINYGFAFVGAGLGTDYDQAFGTSNTVFAVIDGTAGQVGVRLMQMQILPSISYKLNKQHSVGVTLVMGMQTFRAEGLEGFGDTGFANFTDTAGENFTGEGWDWSFGAGIRLGWLGKFMNGDLTLGANYSSRVYMSEFDKYQNLFAEQGDFDIPPVTTIGFAYKVTADINVVMDIQHVEYTAVASVANPGPFAQDPVQLFPTGFSFLGLDNGMGFGWTDQTVYKLGVDFKYNERIILRTGWNYGKSPIPDDQILFNFLAPATVEQHFTMGASYQYNDSIEISVNYMHAFKKTITGKTAFFPVGVTSFDELTEDNAAITMSQNSIGLGVGIQF
jgi:long-chain fatty acid transport protein